MAQRETNHRPAVVFVALMLVGALLIGLATAGLVAAGAADVNQGGAFDWLLAGHAAQPLPAVAQPCMAKLLATDAETRAAVVCSPALQRALPPEEKR